MGKKIKETKRVVIASITVTKVSKMDDAGRKEVADWMRAKADDLEKEGHIYGNKITYTFSCFDE